MRARKPSWLMPWAIAAACGCGGAQAAPETTDANGEAATCGGDTAADTVDEPTADEVEAIDRYSVEVEEMDSEMVEALELSEGPDCAGAAELRGRICELAERICDIADRHPDYGDVAEKCGDSRQRCERATTQVARACS